MPKHLNVSTVEHIFFSHTICHFIEVLSCWPDGTCVLSTTWPESQGHLGLLPSPGLQKAHSWTNCLFYFCAFSMVRALLPSSLLLPQSSLQHISHELFQQLPKWGSFHLSLQMLPNLFWRQTDIELLIFSGMLVLPPCLKNCLALIL